MRLLKLRTNMTLGLIVAASSDSSVFLEKRVIKKARVYRAFKGFVDATCDAGFIDLQQFHSVP